MEVRICCCLSSNRGSGTPGEVPGQAQCDRLEGLAMVAGLGVGERQVEIGPHVVRVDPSGLQIGLVHSPNRSRQNRQSPRIFQSQGLLLGLACNAEWTSSSPAWLSLS